MNIQSILAQTSDWLLSSGLRIGLIIVLAFICLQVARSLAGRMLTGFIKKEPMEDETKKRANTLASLIRYVLSVSILTIALIMILGEFGIAIGPILAAAGIVGVAVGFGAQHLVQDIISGFFILIDNQVRVGDVIQTAGKNGVVERINLRMIVLRDLAGNVHFIRNGNVDVITNMTKEYSRYVFDIGVAYREDIDEVIAVIGEVGADLKNDPKYGPDILEDLEVLGLDQFADSAVIIKARITTKPIKQWQIAREFNRRLKIRFDEKGIEIPFPHQTIYMGQDKQASAPPIRVSMTRE